MDIFNAPWFVPLMVIIVVVGLGYLTLTSPTRHASASGNAPQERTWHVQCPQCRRWKRLRPVDSTCMELTEQNLRRSPQPGMQHQIVNAYKCPFCGHRWQETYVE